jgi:hypothetical protein
VGRELGFSRRPGFEGPEPTQSIHVDLIFICMCDVGLRDAIAIGPRCDLPPIPTVRFKLT